MSVKQIKPKKISEMVREQIEEMIIKGEVHPGDKLASVIQLADEFQVSRSAVREALSALRAVGVITIKQGEGTFVNDYDFSAVMEPLKTERIISKKEMLELFQVRKIMETGAAELAAENRTEKQLASLQAILQEMDKTLAMDQIGEKADMAFHLSIAEASGNQLIVEMMNELSGTLKKALHESRRVLLISEKQPSEVLYEEHEKIYKAICEKKPLEARKAMLLHLTSVEGMLINVYKRISKSNFSGV